MNGDVWLANDGGKGLYELADMPDYGATFRFKIKLNRFVPSKWKQEEIADLPSLTEPARGSQIAVIDDHKINSDALFRQLVDLGIDPDHISVFRSLADYLESGKSAHGIVVDIKTVSNKEEIILLRRMLKNGLESRILVLCSPIMQKSCRKMLKLGKESDLTVIMRPPKHHGLAKYINELPTNAMSIETAREAVRKPSTSVVVVSEGLAPPDSFPSTPLRTATTDVSSNITKFVGSVLDDSYSSDSSLPTVTTPSGTPQIGSEVLTARAAGQQDYFSLPMKHEHQVTAASAVGAEAAGEEAPKPVKKPSAPDVFVETKTGQKVKLPSFKVLVVEDNLINQKVCKDILSL